MKDGVRRGYTEPETHYYLARAYHLSYNFKEAIAEYEKFETTAEKKELSKSDYKAQKLSAESGLNLMNSIKDVQVLEKTEAEKTSFYRYMNIDPSIGKIISTPKELLSKLDLKSKDEHVFFLPNNGKKIFFSSRGKDGANGKDIYMTSRVNGTFTPPVKLKGNVNTEFDEDFAFMHPNGNTLYFASKGHGSMGGYDIFRCEWNASINDFGPAINMDFAINTPDDDLFFITDSLNTTAYFASSRLTSPDKLFVYRVFVNGIPMNITYLKGEFISRINSSETKARIQVFDNLTNRKIMDTQSSESNGQYLLFIPAAGNYTYKIQPPGSPQIHEVQVKIPPSEGSQLFRQEIVYTKIDGREKLEVKSFWDDPLYESIEDLQRQMLLAKSQLDVNAGTNSSSDVAANTVTSNSTSTQASTNSSPAVPVNQRIEIDSVLTSQEKTILALKREIETAEKTSKTLFELVQQTLVETDEAYENFQNARFEAPKTHKDSVRYSDTRKLMIQSQNKSIAAIAAYDISKNREKELREKLLEVEQINTEIKQSIAEKDSPMAAYLVKEYVAKNPNSEKGIATNTAVSWKSENAKTKVDNAKAERNDTQFKINAMTTELNDLEEKSNALSQQLAATKKKKEIERLNSEISAAKAEYESIQEEIEAEKENLRVRELALQESIAMYKLLNDLESEKTIIVDPEFKNATSAATIETLKVEINESKNRVAIAVENSHYENSTESYNAELDLDSSYDVTSKNVGTNKSNSANSYTENASSNSESWDDEIANNDSSNNVSSNNASSNNDSSNNVSSNNASSNNVSSNNDSSNNVSSNNVSSNNVSSNNVSSNNDSSNNASSNNVSSNNDSSNNVSSNNASSNNDSSNNDSSNNVSSNNVSSNNASSNNVSSNNVSSNNDSSNNASSNNVSSNNDSSVRTFSAAESVILNSPVQSNYKEENIFNELSEYKYEIANRAEIEKIYTDIEAIDNLLETETSTERIVELTEQKKQLTYQKMQKEDENSLLISQHNAVVIIDLQSEWETNITATNTGATAEDKVKYEDLLLTIKEAKTLRILAKAEINLFERYAKNTQAFALERKVKTELETLVVKSKPVVEDLVTNNDSSNNVSSNNDSSNNVSSNNASSNNASSNNDSSNNVSSNNDSSNNVSSNNDSSNNVSSNNVSSNNDSSNNASSNNDSSNNVSSNNASSNNVSSNNDSSNNASSNPISSIAELPQNVISTRFERQTTSAYSDTNPIPLAITMPDGAYYTIQIGAFRVPVANDTYDRFAPVYAEQQGNGYIRYSTGFFTSYSEAVKARNEIREMGISDAFIVAYKNRKRVAFSEIGSVTTPIAQVTNPNTTSNSSTASTATNRNTTSNSSTANAATANNNSTAANTSNTNSASTATTSSTTATSSSTETNSNTPNSTSSSASANANANPVSTTTPDLEYYSDPLAVPAQLLEKSEGIFFTVQVGVYARPSRNMVLSTYADLHVEKLPSGRVRYTSGRYKTIAEVSKQRDFCRTNGIPDAFITAYKNGKRITVPEAKKELGLQ
ncbi:MAG: hypothetical protein RLZZ71_2010 [Bacteroidota bacterium]